MKPALPAAAAWTLFCCFLTFGNIDSPKHAIRAIAESGKYERSILETDQTRSPWSLRRKRLEWLHVPKTGTSFGNLLIHWACPQLKNTIIVTAKGVKETDIPERCRERLRGGVTDNFAYYLGDHYSLTNYSDAQLSSIVTMCRSPRTRLASAFYMYNPTRVLATEEEICKYVHSTVADRPLHPTVGVQAKMIAGVPIVRMAHADSNGAIVHSFKSTLPPSDEEVELALSRLPRFAFIGITEYWEASVCLFHATFGGRGSPKDMENVREGSYRKDARALKSVNCGDSADEQMFVKSLSLFFDRLRKYPTCTSYVKLANFGIPAADIMEQEFIAKYNNV